MLIWKYTDDTRGTEENQQFVTDLCAAAPPVYRESPTALMMSLLRRLHELL